MTKNVKQYHKEKKESFYSEYASAAHIERKVVEEDGMKYLSEIIEIAKRISGQNSEKWDEETSLMMDLEFSSMEFFAFIGELEASFGIHLKPREVSRLKNLGDVDRLVDGKLNN